MMTSFFEQYKSPQWQKRRLEMLDAEGWKCSSCGEKESQLHVHHVRYVQGKNVWEYEDDDLRVLCDLCHSAVHDYKDQVVRLISSMPWWLIKRFVSYGTAVYAMHAHDLGRANKIKIVDVDGLSACEDFFRVDGGSLLKCANGDGWIDIADIKELIGGAKNDDPR